MDSDYESLYAAEQRTANIFTIFSLLALTIAVITTGTQALKAANTNPAWI
ncbi:MAG: hypothetical protein ACLFM7_00400 [Bacteroidales bacterium]